MFNFTILNVSILSNVMRVLCCEQSKVGGTGGAGSFEEVLSSAAQASAQDTPTNNVTENSER